MTEIGSSYGQIIKSLYCWLNVLIGGYRRRIFILLILRVKEMSHSVSKMSNIAVKSIPSGDGISFFGVCCHTTKFYSHVRLYSKALVVCPIFTAHILPYLLIFVLFSIWGYCLTSPTLFEVIQTVFTENGVYRHLVPHGISCWDKSDNRMSVK